MFDAILRWAVNAAPAKAWITDREIPMLNLCLNWSTAAP
jgi:hypothetical protein